MAKWKTSYTNRLPDKNFLYVAPGGRIDDTGKTKPRTKRHFPVRDVQGRVSPTHVRSVLGAYGARASVPASALSHARKQAKRLLAREHLLREVDLELLKGALHAKRRAA